MPGDWLVVDAPNAVWRQFYSVGCREADAVRMPQWKPGSEFKARRDESMAGRK